VSSSSMPTVEEDLVRGWRAGMVAGG
jgi:hypothetical protein